MQNFYSIDGMELKKLMHGAFNNLVKNRDQINFLNVFPVPDGDTGTNMFLTVSSAVKEVDVINTNEVGPIVQAMSKGALMGARGNSGVILSQLFRGFAESLRNKETIDYKDVTIAAENAVAMAYKAVLKPVEGTILTVAKAVARGIKDASYSTRDIRILLQQGILAGEIALDKTPEMLPALAKAGVVDAGGKGLIVMLQGVANLLDGKDIEDFTIEDEAKPVSFVSLEEVGKNIYCTECIIKGTSLKEDEILKEISSLGESTLVVGDGKLIKLHIHTDNPGRVLEIGLKFGSLHDLKIENMLDQNRTNEQHNLLQENKEEPKDVGVIAVVAGDGLADILKSMGVDIVIEGGQTMNPSTEHLLDAIEKINAHNILILPNNSNIIMAAQQAAELTDKNIKVLPTKTFPQGMSAMLGFDSSQDIDINYKNMMEHFEDVLTGEITYAVRDTVFDDIDIKTGDILAILEGSIIHTGKDIYGVTLKLLTSLVEDKEAELITVFYGDDITEGQVQKLQGKFNELHTDVEFEAYKGGQPLYYYIVSAE